jgi:biopolymer transport protein ExbB
MKKFILTTIAAVLAIGPLSIQAQEEDAPQAATLQELVQIVRSATEIQSAQLRQREAEFRENRANQQRLLQEARQERDALERRSEELKDEFDANEIAIADREQQLAERLGTLRELFGHLTGTAGDVREMIDLSITSAQYPGRTEFITPMIEKMSSTTRLPTVAEIQRLWEEYLQEIIYSSEVVSFNTTVVRPDGQQEQREVVRVGNYNLVSDGEYLAYDPSTQLVSVLPSQPAGRFTSQAEDLQGGTDQFNRVGVDLTGPIGGNFLRAIIATPSLVEKWHQGGYVGYIITGLFVIAVLISLIRLFDLVTISGRVNKQLKSNAANDNNPLGRVLKVYESSRSADVETLELKLGEAILKERPRIEAWLTVIKIIAAVAPLMGLLGTVTGMIVVFQGITLFGAGDVQGMAGGISQALVTTVLGLCVAIPTILLHTLLNSRAMRIIHILDEQSAGIVAERAEAK